MNQDDKKPRKGTTEAAPAKPAERDAAETEAEAGKDKRGEIPDWQRPDYSGGLTGDQAMWRNKHITTK